MSEPLRQGILTLTVAGLVLCAGGPAGASEFGAFDRRGQIEAADAVVTGEVLGTHASWNAEGSAIITEAEVRVDEAWKGEPSDRIDVRTLGGTVGTVRLEVEGAAKFEAGERVVLFLDRVGDAWTPAGMVFGKLHVEGDGADAFALGTLPPATPGASRYETVSISMDELRAEVRSAVAGEVR
jgi:hypothetical protein